VIPLCDRKTNVQGIIFVDIEDKMIYYYERQYVEVDVPVFDIKQFEKVEIHIIPKLQVC
jgi:hypothetical protein